MSTITNHINTYADLTAYDNADKDYPNISYIEEDGVVLFVKINYAQQYFAIESLEDDNAVKFKTSSASSVKTISVSTDDGKTWTDYTSTTGGTTIATLNMGEKVLIKGNNNTYGDSSVNSNFTANKTFDVSGNIMSLIYGDNYKKQYSFPSGTQYSFIKLFQSAPVVSAENLILPATTLEQSCYSGMFYGCTSLTTAPVLPATTLASYCYDNMFLGCTSLTTAPELNATTLANHCYRNMFQGCTSLTTAPTTLPATILASNCYENMFWNCTSLETAPELPATTLTYYCYGYMFSGCTSLVNAPKVLPATTLAGNCYRNMFSGCTSLVKAPEISATNLAFSSCGSMFYNCTSLNYIKAMFTTTPGAAYTSGWVDGVASSGTFVKNSAATWANTYGNDAIPTGWTVQTASS